MSTPNATWGRIARNAIRGVSWLIAVYFLYSFHKIAGFPPINDLNATSLTYLVLFVFFSVLPLAHRLKLGDLLEYESKVLEVKTELREFKSETRDMLSVYNSLINTVNNTISNTVNVNLPGVDEAAEAREELRDAIKTPTDLSSLEARIRSFLASEGSDPNYALAKLRMDLERELRRILGRRLEAQDPASMKGQFLSARSLFRRFLKLHSEYEGMEPSFDYVLRVCNAAIHDQRIPEGHVHEALHMGIRMLDELKEVDNA